MKIENLLVKVGVVVIVILAVVFVIYATNHDEEQALIAKQLAYEKWSQNDLFMNTLERYNEIYHRLDQDNERNPYRC